MVLEHQTESILRLDVREMYGSEQTRNSILVFRSYFGLLKIHNFKKSLKPTRKSWRYLLVEKLVTSVKELLENMYSKYDRKMGFQWTAYVSKLWSEMNRTTLGVGHFNTVSGHFFAKYIISFHKTEDLTIILRCPTF